MPRPGACRGCCGGGPREAGSAFVQVRRVTSFRAVPWPCGRVLHECAHVCWFLWCHRCLRLFDECALAQHALRAHYYVAYVANTLFLLQLRACAGLALPVVTVLPCSLRAATSVLQKRSKRDKGYPNFFKRSKFFLAIQGLFSDPKSFIAIQNL